MPFNIPYGTPISMDRRTSAGQAAVDEATKRGWAMNVSVVDPNGDLIAFDGWTARVSLDFDLPAQGARCGAIPPAVQGVRGCGAKVRLQLHPHPRRRHRLARRHSAGRGWQDHRRIGCSGGTGSQDEATCTAAASAINK